MTKVWGDLFEVCVSIFRSSFMPFYIEAILRLSLGNYSVYLYSLVSSFLCISSQNCPGHFFYFCYWVKLYVPFIVFLFTICHLPTNTSQLYIKKNELPKEKKLSITGIIKQCFVASAQWFNLLNEQNHERHNVLIFGLPDGEQEKL